MGNAVKHSSDVAGHVGVPGVRVEDVGFPHAIGDLQVDAESLDRGVRRSELGRIVVSVHRDSSGRNARFARPVEGVNVDVGMGRQHFGQFFNVDTRATVDVWRVFSSQ